MHRELDGSWAVCREPTSCPLRFHFPGMDVEKAAAIPLDVLLPLLEIADPPHKRSVLFDSKIWHNAAGQQHRDYDLPAVVAQFEILYQWWQEGKLHRAGGKPAVIHVDGGVEYWEGGKRLR